MSAVRAPSGRTFVRWARSRRALSVVVALAAITMVGCGRFGDRIDNGFSVANRTGHDLTIVYLAKAEITENGHVVDRNGTTDLGLAPASVTTLMNVPSPLQDSCLIAPIVARRADGSEVARYDTGACVGRELITWTIE